MSVRYRAPGGPTLDFPEWVKITACERETRTRQVETPHGCVREESSDLTDHGRAMTLWRTHALTPEQASEPPAPRVLSRALRLALPVSGRRRRVPGNVTPGRYSW